MEPAQGPVVLSAFDVPSAHGLVVHACEDCACPVTDDASFRAPGPVRGDVLNGSAQWVCGREVLQIPLDNAHRLLFNPVGDGGAVVVNAAAYRIFHCFTHPADLGRARQVAGTESRDTDEVLLRLIQFGMLHPAGATQRPTFRPSSILTAWLHVTNDCNLRCPYCYVHKSAEGMDEATGRAAVDAVVRSAVAHGFRAIKLKYAGGEASLNHRLVADLHVYARATAARHGLRLHATLLSNGVALTPSFVKVLRDGQIRVMVSLDGLGVPHDAQRPSRNGGPSFRLVERTVERLVQGGHPPHLSITITSRNVAGVADVVRYALARDLTFSLNFFRDNDCAAALPDLRYEEQAMVSGLQAAFSVIEERLPPWSVLGSILDKGQLLQPRRRSCGVGQDYVVIDQRGQVAKCHMEIERTIGDVFHDDPLALVRADQRSALNLVSDEKEGCRDCTWRYWCTGGCTVATFRATGRHDIKSPNCNIYKAIYPAALRLEGLRLLKYAAAGGRPATLTAAPGSGES